MNKKKMFKDILKFSIPTIVSAIVAIVVLPLISRVYPEAEYGYISNFYSIGNLLQGMVFLGLDSAYIRYFNEPPAGMTRNGIFVFVGIIGVLVTVCLWIVVLFGFPQNISYLVFNDTEIKGIFLLGIYVLELVIYRITNINYRFSNNAKAYNIQQIGFIIGNRLLFISATVISTQYMYSITVMVIATLFIGLFSLWRQRSCFKDVKINVMACKELFSFALPVMPATVITLLNNSIAKLILGGYGRREDVGILAIATSAANIFSVIPNAFGVYWGPFVYTNYRKEHEIIKQVHDIIMLLSISLLIGILIFQDVIYLFLGESYRSSKEYFMLIMLSPVFSIIAETTTYGINLSKRTKHILYTSIIGCLFNIIICSILIPLIGVYGAALGVGFSAMIIFVIRSVIAQKYYVSIINKYRTIIGCVIILGLCVGNFLFSKYIGIRAIVIISVLILVFILYKETIHNIYSGLKKSRTKIM